MRNNFFKNILIYLCIVFGCIAVFQVMSRDHQDIEELSSSEFLSAAVAGEYTEVTIVAADNAWEVTGIDKDEKTYKATIPPQDELVSELNEAGVNLMLRIHCNGSSRSTVRGIGLYVNRSFPISAESRRAAECILPRMAEATGAKARGVYRRDTYTGLNWSEAPAVLVECGYLTHPEEDRLLNDPAYQAKLAAGIVEGLCDYFGR